MENNTQGMPQNEPIQPEPKPPEILVVEALDASVKTKGCPVCGTINTTDAKFCHHCGKQLPDASAPGKKICAGCNTPNEPTSQFCYKCGLKLPEAATVSGLKYAGFWIRLVAWLIDNIILGTVTGIISIPFLIPLMREMTNEIGSTSYNYYSDPYSFYSSIMNSTFYWHLMSFYVVFGLVQMAIYCAYNTVAVGKWGTTIGKTALGLKIVRTDGSRVSNWRAFARYWAQAINGFTLGLSYLVIAFSKKKQGIHDMICETLVVKKN